MTQLERLWVWSMQLFAYCCHQRPERSFFVGKYQLPLCARCCGLLLGHLTGFASVCLTGPMPLWRCAALMIPMALDGMVQFKTAYRSTNPRRLVTGALFGFASMYLAAQASALLRQRFSR